MLVLSSLLNSRSADGFDVISLVPVSGLEDLEWEVLVIKDDSIKNAFVIPG